MQQVRRLIETIAPTDASVMILGETGTGKELIARNLHDKSRRADRAFIPVNCGALPENLVESELFGHRKGAFTGADTNRKGLFEVANGGTLFLDEVGELDKSVQVKLLRFLESGEIRRVGENEPFRVDVRVLCATNRDLREMVEQRPVPRRPVFPAQHIRDPPASAARAARPTSPRSPGTCSALRLAARPTESTITPEAVDVLLAHEWPGNIRELANVIERATILAGDGPILPEHLPTQLPARGKAPGRHRRRRRPPFPDPRGQPDPPRHRDEYIQVILEKHSGNKPAASKELGISLKTLYNKINQLQHT